METPAKGGVHTPGGTEPVGARVHHAARVSRSLKGRR